MVDVQPLHGLRYTHTHVKDLAQVVTPPFDVISPAAQERYYERHPLNAIRLELGRQRPDDTSLDNVYTRAAATLSEWRLKGFLHQEAQPCYYFYQQRFHYGTQEYTRTSLLARVRLEPWSERAILPHEHIRTKDKEDRFNLLRACATNFSPIMSMYDDPQGRIRRLLHGYEGAPEIQFVDEAGEEHRLHPITDPEQVAWIQDFFAPRQLYIADGHHRYTTALQYRDEVHEQRLGLHPQDGVNFVMMALIDVDDPGMLVLPTHRLLTELPSEALDALTSAQLTRYFRVQELDSAISQTALLAALTQAGQHHPSFVLKTPTSTLLLSANEQGSARMQHSQHTPAWNELDVAILQTLLFEELLGLTAEDIAAGRALHYVHDATQALEALERNEAQAILLLNGMPFRQIRDVALADERMPQKSTYLYPKLLTGLVLNPLW